MPSLRPIAYSKPSTKAMPTSLALATEALPPLSMGIAYQRSVTGLSRHRVWKMAQALGRAASLFKLDIDRQLALVRTTKEMQIRFHDLITQFSKKEFQTSWAQATTHEGEDWATAKGSKVVTNSIHENHAIVQAIQNGQLAIADVSDNDGKLFKTVPNVRNNESARLHDLDGYYHWDYPRWMNVYNSLKEAQSKESDPNSALATLYAGLANQTLPYLRAFDGWVLDPNSPEGVFIKEHALEVSGIFNGGNIIPESEGGPETVNSNGTSCIVLTQDRLLKVGCALASLSNAYAHTSAQTTLLLQQLIQGFTQLQLGLGVFQANHNDSVKTIFDGV